jgi:hypothetical protein
VESYYHIALAVVIAQPESLLDAANQCGHIEIGCGLPNLERSHAFLLAIKCISWLRGERKSLGLLSPPPYTVILSGVEQPPRCPPHYNRPRAFSHSFLSFSEFP